MNQQRRMAWAYLSRVFEGPSRTLNAVLREGIDVEELAHAIRHREEWLGELLAQTEARWDWDVAAADLEAARRVGARLVTPEDKEWPAEQFDMAFGFAERGSSEHVRSYQADATAPHALWVRGESLAKLCQRSVAVVGTRAISAYGAGATRLLVGGLVDKQFTIVSGGALGVDTIAHQEALDRGGATIAVAACGIDRRYPARNAELFERIAATGALCTEYPPGMAPHRHRFLTRNRLVAALTQGTVVVEAAWRSGALNTLSWATGLGRVAMAVPGPITNASSLGCHERIKRGEAELVCSAEEIRALVARAGEVDVEGQYELEFAANEVQKLSRNELRVYDSLGAKPAGAQEVAAEAGMRLPLAVHLLVELERRGLVKREGSAWLRA